jgi:hypothetical protein
MQFLKSGRVNGQRVSVRILGEQTALVGKSIVKQTGFKIW